MNFFSNHREFHSRGIHWMNGLFAEIWKQWNSIKHVHLIQTWRIVRKCSQFIDVVMCKNGKKKKIEWSLELFVCSSAYEIWGSPEMLSKEKIRRAKTRQDEYAGKCLRELLAEWMDFSVSALFTLKKSVKEYQKRLLLLENASFENRKSVNSIDFPSQRTLLLH